jgi:FAD/FMN-containing dehydrogenase
MPFRETSTVSAARQLEHELIQRVEGEVRFDAVSRALYSTDASNYQIEPVGVVYPRHTDDVAAVHAAASQYGVAVLPRGSGSSLAGQAVGHAIILDLSRHMAGVVSIDVQGRRVRVQPGVVLGHLNRQLAPLGLMIGPDPASGDRATIGGCIGNNATGMHSILYGMFSDHVTACEVVLADGEKVRFDAGAARTEREARLRDGVRQMLLDNANEIRSRYPKTWRSVAGYPLDRLDPEALNLATLFAGSEGTLGTVVAADLALVERPAMVRMVLLQLDSLRAALELVPAILETGPSSVELIDRLLLDMTRRHVEFSRHLTFVTGDPSAVLAVE